MTVSWGGFTWECDIAVKGSDYVKLYTNDFQVVATIKGITKNEWVNIFNDGTWSTPDVIPTKDEIMRADIDYINMLMEAMTADNEQARADIDYLLMISGE